MIEYKLLSTSGRETGPRTDIQEAIHKRRTSNQKNRTTYLITVVVAVFALLTYAFYSFMFNGAPEPGTNENKTPQQTGNPIESDKNTNKGSENSNNKTNDVPGNENNNTGIPNAANPPNQGEIETPVAGDQVIVVLKGKTETSWARIYVDGRVVFTGEIKPGDVKQFTGNTGVKFRLGNAGGVEVTVNGKEQGTLGSSGQVIDKEYIKE